MKALNNYWISIFINICFINVTNQEICSVCLGMDTIYVIGNRWGKKNLRSFLKNIEFTVNDEKWNIIHYGREHKIKSDVIARARFK